MGKQKLPFDQNKEYDLVVIGGGTGGITAASEARKFGMSVALFDYVSPSPQGSTWGLGGTCVNVGCIPKKLFHIAAQNHDISKSAQDFGWKGSDTLDVKHDWVTLRANIQGYIKSINFSYNKKMTTEGIDYINAKASFADANTVEFEYSKPFQNEAVNYKIKGKNFVIATGGRPRSYPGIPDELCITSDDLFSLEKDPGTTLVVGGGYIAIECAGFLAGLGKEVHLLNRSTFLRTMDQDMAEKIVEQLEEEGVNAYTSTKVLGVKLLQDGRKQVDLEVNKKAKSIVVDTIMVAIGRDCNPAGLKV